MIYDLRLINCTARVGRFRFPLAVVLSCLWLTLVSTLAFPPAPHHVIHGSVRDEYGEPLALSSAQVFLETTNGTVIACQVSPDVLPGENYRLIVPMDSLTVPDPYKSTALRAAIPFRLKVKIGNTIYLPVEMSGNFATLGQPAGETLLQLTLGVDSDGDGLPDAWENIIIQMLGGGLTLANITPNGIAPNGMTYYANYVAGTYAWDTADTFRLAISRGNGSGPVLRFFAVANRTYAIEATTNLVTWSPATVRLPAGNTNAPGVQQFYNSISQIIEPEVVLGSNQPTAMFFRVRVN